MLFKPWQLVMERLQAAGLTQLTINAEDMQEQELGDVAIISFHLREQPLCRGTFVLQHGVDEWRIVPLVVADACGDELTRHEATVQMYTNLCFKTVTSAQVVHGWDMVTQLAGTFAQTMGPETMGPE